MPLSISDVAKLEKNKLFSDGVWIILLEADFTPWGFDIIRICRNTEDITWPDNTAGYTWVAFPFELEVKQESSKGEIPKLTVRVSNVNRFIQSYVEQADGAISAKITLRLVHSKHLDNPVPEFEEVYEVTATECTADWVTFTLGAPNPFLLQFPQAKYLKNFCRCIFVDAACTIEVCTTAKVWCLPTGWPSPYAELGAAAMQSSMSKKRWAKMRPAKTNVFFVHCRGRSALMMANTLLGAEALAKAAAISSGEEINQSSGQQVNILGRRPVHRSQRRRWKPWRRRLSAH